MGKQWKHWKSLFSWVPKSLQMVTTAMKLKDGCSLVKSYDKPRQHIKKQRHHFAYKGPYSQSYGFSSSHVWMWELDRKEGWVLKNLCFPTLVWEKTLESPLEFKEIKPVNLKRSQPWIVIGRTIAAVPIIWLPNGKSHLFGKDPDTGKDWEQEVKGVTEDEMVGWHHQLNGHEFEQNWEIVKDREEQPPGVLWSTGLQRVKQGWVTEHKNKIMCV